MSDEAVSELIYSLPAMEFEGRTGNGDFADSVVEMDHRVGHIVAAVKELGIEDNTLLIFCSESVEQTNEDID